MRPPIDPDRVNDMDDLPASIKASPQRRRLLVFGLHVAMTTGLLLAGCELFTDFDRALLTAVGPDGEPFPTCLLDASHLGLDGGDASPVVDAAEADGDADSADPDSGDANGTSDANDGSDDANDGS
jgi:hypothetical protein